MTIDDERDYTDLIAAVGDQWIADREQYFYAICSTAVTRHQVEQNAVHISTARITEIVMNYLADLHRLKGFHGIERANGVKRAAYQAYWLARVQPIQLIRDNDVAPHARKINGLAAWMLVLDSLYETDVRNFRDADQLKSFNRFVSNLLYTFRYRQYSAQSLELAIEGLLTQGDPHPRRRASGD